MSCDVVWCRVRVSCGEARTHREQPHGSYEYVTARTGDCRLSWNRADHKNEEEGARPAGVAVNTCYIVAKREPSSETER